MLGQVKRSLKIFASAKMIFTFSISIAFLEACIILPKRCSSTLAWESLSYCDGDDKKTSPPQLVAKGLRTKFHKTMGFQWILMDFKQGHSRTRTWIFWDYFLEAKEFLPNMCTFLRSGSPLGIPNAILLEFYYYYFFY